MIYEDLVPVYFSHPTEVPTAGWRWENFIPEEIASNGDGSVLIVPLFLDKMQLLRRLAGHPLVITSWYRDPVYNKRISSTGLKGPHTTGRAADIGISGAAAYALIEHIPACGFTGCGISQKGSYSSRFIHVDDLEKEDGFPTRPGIWSY
jgi:uncharacterized protein YcbK (DUF882 family)